MNLRGFKGSSLNICFFSNVCFWPYRNRLARDSNITISQTYIKILYTILCSARAASLIAMTGTRVALSTEKSYAVFHIRQLCTVLIDWKFHAAHNCDWIWHCITSTANHVVRTREAPTQCSILFQGYLPLFQILLKSTHHNLFLPCLSISIWWSKHAKLSTKSASISFATHSLNKINLQ